ncbi:MAG: DUF3047 domain-containing protein [Gammaproteobacteria bacterium]|nr:DUF3047 domain-containing protein [Gammaproteobacteria bacterium]
MQFPGIENHTAYFLLQDNKLNHSVVKAVSHNAASGLYRKVNIDPAQYPSLEWRWKISNILKKGDVYTKQGDDYAARIYVSFHYDANRLTGMEKVKYRLYRMLRNEPPPLAVINYIWANKAKPGTVVDNAYSPRVKMIVIDSGNNNTNKWRYVRRNVYQDYLKVFGEKPGNITGVAIMTDTDNTGESATAWYGDISLAKSNREAAD